MHLRLPCNFVHMKDVVSLPWTELEQQLNAQGYAHIAGLVSEAECNELIPQYSSVSLYRNTINMERYRFGKGEYKYFNYPLLPQIARLRKDFYPPLAKLANQWSEALDLGFRYPDSHEAFLEACRKAGQVRPTPLILKYETGGYNTLHQDLYGEVYFPFQVLFVLSDQGKDFEGGEFVMTEQLPRAQSRAHVIHPQQGDAIIFTTNFRPVEGSRGFYKSRMKHGVSTITKGNRSALGIIFHDAA